MSPRFLTLVTALLSFQAIAESNTIDEVTIIGVAADAKKLPGSAFVVDTQTLEKFEYTDINRMVRQVPGIYLQEEDGFGLRPNIGIRGAGAERSEKITLMEDGVLIAPAPYAAPSAYYFPTAGRMSGIEILKGANILRHGPATVAGIVNMISTEIPSEESGEISLEAGQYGSNRLHINYGESHDQSSWLLETHQQESDGFKDIDRSGNDTGFYIEDYLAKFRLNSDSNASFYHQLDLKLQYSEETSDQTYVGLSDADFKADENSLYGLTALDEMNTRHSGSTLKYLFKPSDQFKLTTTAYYNRFKRDWFKVDKIDGSSFGSVISAANDGDTDAQSVLSGNTDADIGIKHNNREYVSKGIDIVADWTVQNHELQGGIRAHKDDVDRFQPTENFRQANSTLTFTSISNPSSSNNRVEEAEALAIHVMDVWKITDSLELTLGLRNEDIDTQQRRYSAVDRSSSTVTAKNSVDELLWSIGGTYDIDEHWQVLAGAHSGFAPASPGSQNNVDPEKSNNFEAGFRFEKNDLSISTVAFYSDYSNKVTNCSVAFPCGAATSGSESDGESEVKGLEFNIVTDLHMTDDFTIPTNISYTYTDGEISDNKDSSNLDGDVLAYVPENIFNAQIGLEFNSGWVTYLSMSYVDEMCVNNTCERSDVDGTFEKTDDFLIFDLASHYPINASTNAYLKVDNIFDEQKVVARSPGGARPSKPRTATVGVRYSF